MVRVQRNTQRVGILAAECAIVATNPDIKRTNTHRVARHICQVIIVIM